MLANVNKQDDGEYECFLPNGLQETIKLTVFGRQDDLNSISLDDDNVKVNELTNELSEVDEKTMSNETPEIGLKYGKEKSYKKI